MGHMLMGRQEARDGHNCHNQSGHFIAWHVTTGKQWIPNAHEPVGTDGNYAPFC
jgi:hypothetical protein